MGRLDLRLKVTIVNRLSINLPSTAARSQDYDYTMAAAHVDGLGVGTVLGSAVAGECISSS